MAAEPVDVLVIGGGITGAGIARDAALRGFRTAVVDKGDLGGGSSSLSSRLIHGGIRYLEQGQFRLVFEASRERRVLLGIAPHLVQDRKSTRLNSSHRCISYAVFCLKKKKQGNEQSCIHEQTVKHDIPLIHP